MGNKIYNRLQDRASELAQQLATLPASHHKTALEHELALIFAEVARVTTLYPSGANWVGVPMIQRCFPVALKLAEELDGKLTTIQMQLTADPVRVSASKESSEEAKDDDPEATDDDSDIEDDFKKVFSSEANSQPPAIQQLFNYVSRARNLDMLDNDRLYVSEDIKDAITKTSSINMGAPATPEDKPIYGRCTDSKDDNERLFEIYCLDGSVSLNDLNQHNNPFLYDQFDYFRARADQIANNELASEGNRRIAYPISCSYHRGGTGLNAYHWITVILEFEGWQADIAAEIQKRVAVVDKAVYESDIEHLKKDPRAGNPRRFSRADVAIRNDPEIGVLLRRLYRIVRRITIESTDDAYCHGENKKCLDSAIKTAYGKLSKKKSIKGEIQPDSTSCGVLTVANIISYLHNERAFKLRDSQYRNIQTIRRKHFLACGVPFQRRQSQEYNIEQVALERKCWDKTFSAPKIHEKAEKPLPVLEASDEDLAAKNPNHYFEKTIKLFDTDTITKTPDDKTATNHLNKHYCKLQNAVIELHTFLCAEKEKNTGRENYDSQQHDEQMRNIGKKTYLLLNTVLENTSKKCYFTHNKHRKQAHKYFKEIKESLQFHSAIEIKILKCVGIIALSVIALIAGMLAVSSPVGLAAGALSLGGSTYYFFKEKGLNKRVEKVKNKTHDLLRQHAFDQSDFPYITEALNEYYRSSY